MSAERGPNPEALSLVLGAEPLTGYRLIERLGQGGYGEVWKADAPGGFQVALKFVRLQGGAGAVETRSLEIINRIRHAHLLSQFGAWQVGEWLVVGMELADRSLLDRFREAVPQGFPGIPGPELLEYMLEAAKGIDFLNEPRHPIDGEGLKGIQHRDIKPPNLLLVGGSVKVADFGLARMLEQSVTGHTGSMTPAYAAPEFFNGRTSSQSDQYCLAVTYCHLRGGRLPFTGSFAEVMAGHLMREPDLTMLPSEERAPVARALAKEPKQRHSSCRGFVEALRCGMEKVETWPDPGSLMPQVGNPGASTLPLTTGTSEITVRSGVERPAVSATGEKAGDATRPVRLTVHWAFFVRSSVACCFINATNLCRDHDLEITHVWIELQPQVHVFNKDRPLPKRLRPFESWETWIELGKLPQGVPFEAFYQLARARISTGEVFSSIQNVDVPDMGVVPGGPIEHLPS